jgi:DNA-binding NarL/FixJ family response regulator
MGDVKECPSLYHCPVNRNPSLPASIPGSEVSMPRTAPYFVLIVDPMPAIREALQWVIEEEGIFHVAGTASTGKEALHYAESIHPEIVILDIDLPDTDGCSLAGMLTRQPKPPYIIFLTVYPERDIHPLCPDVRSYSIVQKHEGWPALIREMLRHVQNCTEIGL